MKDNLLTIGEVARLIGVSESTLRDWDATQKLPSTRTDGGHRRYTLDLVRGFLDSQPQKVEESVEMEAGTQIFGPMKDAADRISASGDDLAGVAGSHQRQTLAVLLENFLKYHETYIEPEVFPRSWGMGLTRKVFKACRFWKMLSVQPMLGPASLVYFVEKSNNGSMCVRSDAVAAKTFNYNLSLLDQKFDEMVDFYAQAMAKEIEFEMLKRLPRIDGNIYDILNSPDRGAGLLGEVDYLIGPKPLIDTLQVEGWSENIDLFDVPVVLDEKSLNPIVAGGKYPSSNIAGTPIFAPYMLAMPGGKFLNGTRSLMYRAGWYEKKN